MKVIKILICAVLLGSIEMSLPAQEGGESRAESCSSSPSQQGCTETIQPLAQWPLLQWPAVQWEVASFLRSSRESTVEIDLKTSEYTVLLQYPNPQKIGIQLSPRSTNITIRLGELALSGVPRLLQNPLANNARSLSALPLRLSRRSSAVPSLLLSTPYTDVYGSYFNRRSLGLIGVDFRIPFFITGLARYKFIDIPPEHSIMRFIFQYETWKGQGSNSLVDSQWLPGVYKIFNASSIISVPFYINSDTSSSQQTVEALFGLQSQLPRRTISQRLYNSYPSVFWMRLHFATEGRLGIYQQYAMEWNARAEFLHLSDSYIRATSQSLLDPDTSFIFTGNLKFTGIIDISSLLQIHAQKNTRLQIGVESDIPNIAFGAVFNVLPDTNRFNTRLYFRTLGIVKTEVSLRIHRMDLISRFENFEFKFALALDTIRFGTDLTIGNNEDFQNTIDFFPSPFETTINISFDFKIEGYIMDTLTSLQLKLGSPRNFLLSGLLYEEALGGFFENWSIELALELSN